MVQCTKRTIFFAWVSYSKKITFCRNWPFLLSTNLWLRSPPIFQLCSCCCCSCWVFMEVSSSISNMSSELRVDILSWPAAVVAGEDARMAWADASGISVRFSLLESMWGEVGVKWLLFPRLLDRSTDESTWPLGSGTTCCCFCSDFSELKLNFYVYVIQVLLLDHVTHGQFVGHSVYILYVEI